MSQEKKSRVTRNEDGSITYALKVPIDHAEKKHESVTLRGVATVDDLEAMDQSQGEVAKTKRLISELSGLSLGTIAKMRAADYFALGGLVAEVLGNESPKTGGTS